MLWRFEGKGSLGARCTHTHSVGLGFRIRSENHLP